MNIALTRKGDQGIEFYLAAVKRSGDVYTAVSKRIHSNGRIVAFGPGFKYNTEKEANQKVRDLIKIKIKRQNWMPVDLKKLPEPVVRHLEVPPELQVTPQELLMILRDAERERYVVFQDVSGLEEYFDADVEYIGYETDDNQTIKVFDRYGVLRECFKARVKSSSPTERASEAKVIAEKVGR